MVYLFSFLMDVTVVLLMLGLTFRAVDAGASPTALGLLGSAPSASYGLICFCLARWFSAVDARISSIASSAFLLVLCLLSAAATTVPLFIVLGLLIGVVSAFFWPPLEHYLGRGKSGDGLYRVLTRFNLWWCTGYAAATAVCGTLYGWDFRAPFLIAAACLAPIIAGGALLRPGTSDRPEAVSSPEITSHTPAGLAGKRFFLATARIFILLTYASAGCVFALFPKLGDHLCLSKPVVSYIIFSIYLGQLVSFYLLGKSSRWHNSVGFLLVAQGAMALAFFAVFAFDSGVAFAGAFAVVGLASGLSYFSSLFYTLHEPVFRSSLAGVHEALLAAGRVFGAIFSGIVASAFNLKAPYLFLACVFSLLALQTIVQSRRIRRSPNGFSSGRRTGS